MRERNETIHHLESMHQQESAYYQGEIQRLPAELEGLRMNDIRPSKRGSLDVSDDDDDGDGNDRADS